MVLVVLVVLFVALPLVELYVMVTVAGQIGVMATLASLVAISALGAWLVKREGLGVLQRINTDLAAGQLPTDALVDGALVLVAGLMCLVPGFVTDAVGLLLLVPPVRIGLRHLLVRRLQRRIDRAAAAGSSARFFVTRVGDFGEARFGSATVFTSRDVIDTTARDSRPAGSVPSDDPWPRSLGSNR